MSDRIRGNKKPTESTDTNLAALRTAYFEYVELSKLLFASTQEIIYDINELPDTSKFLEPAKKIANELGVSWESMTHEESNRIMLALLEEYYNKMAEVADTTDIILQVSFKLNSKNEQRKKKQTIGCL